MLKTFEAIIRSRKTSHKTSYKLNSPITAHWISTWRITTRRSVLSTLAPCLIISLVAVIGHAQEAAPTALKTAADSCSWSLGLSGSRPAPYLVISMADLRDTSSNGSFGISDDAPTIVSAKDTITLEGTPAASANRTQTVDSVPLQLTSLIEPATDTHSLTDLQAEPTSPRDTIRLSPKRTVAGTYSLLDDKSLPGSATYRYQETDFRSQQWIADNESAPNEIDQAQRPLIQLPLGDWSLPIKLSSAAATR